MKTRRTFRKEFKRQVVEEVPSSDTNTIATCRKYYSAYPVVGRCKKRLPPL
jgi:transposase-like protein